MTEKLNQEMNVIIKMWHIIVAIISFAFMLGGAYYQVFANKSEIDKFKEWKDARISTFDSGFIEMKTKIEFLYDQKMKELDRTNNNLQNNRGD